MEEFTINFGTMSVAHSTIMWALEKEVENCFAQALRASAYLDTLDSDTEAHDMMAEHNASEHYHTMIEFAAENLMGLAQFASSKTMARREAMKVINAQPASERRYMWKEYKRIRKYNKNMKNRRPASRKEQRYFKAFKGDL